MRPVLEVADIFRRHGEAFRVAQGSRLLPDQRRVMAAIEACRTATLGGHVEQCDDCGQVRIAYNSCLMGKFRNGELATRCIGGSVDFGFDSPLRTAPWAGNQPSGGQRVVSAEQVAQWPQWLRAFRRDPRRRQISVVAGFPRPIHDDTQRRPCVAPERDLLSADLGAQPL
jgi:hypothetical protein